MATTDDPGEIGFHLFIHVIDGRPVERFLIVLQNENVVSFAVDNLFGDGRLSPHRIDRDDGPLQIDPLQNRRNCRDFIRFLLARDLPQRQAEFRAPDTDGMQNAQSRVVVMASSQGLSVDRQNGLGDTGLLGGLRA